MGGKLASGHVGKKCCGVAEPIVSNLYDYHCAPTYSDGTFLSLLKPAKITIDEH